MVTASDMKGKAALVTGAASGLGRATALALAKAGADLCLVDINAAGLAETADAASALKVRVRTVEADISRIDACKSAVAAVVEAFGRLDALCNVAGVLKFAHTADMSAEDYALVINVNLNAPFWLSQAAIPHLLKADGAIVNVTSCAAFLGEAYAAAYCATKAGLSHMTKAMAMEFINKPIRINALAPGGMMTPMGTGMTVPDDVDRALFARFVPLRGVIDVADVANVIAYLASDAARGFHGAVIQMDKGITAG